MGINSATDRGLAQELGARLKRARLNANLTQGEVAERSGISRTGVASVESGTGLLETMIAIMRTLNLIDQLDAFLPPQPVSPVQLAKLQGKTRKRATGSTKKSPVTPSGGSGSW